MYGVRSTSYKEQGTTATRVASISSLVVQCRAVRCGAVQSGGLLPLGDLTRGFLGWAEDEGGLLDSCNSHLKKIWNKL